jgi:hypothetical protein
VEALVANGMTGNVLHQTLDRFGLDLVTSEGSRGKTLARSTVLQYLGQVKNWFLDRHPCLAPLLTKRQSAVYSSLETHFKAASSGTASRQAPACTKNDLAALVDIIWRTADSEVDFHDGALVIMMWHVLGRSSDMTQLTKQNVVVHPGGVFSIRFGRVETGVEQGISLFCWMDFRTCPVHAMALMTAMDRVPAELVFRQLPRWVTNDVDVEAQEVVPLLSLLQSRDLKEVKYGGEDDKSKKPCCFISLWTINLQEENRNLQRIRRKYRSMVQRTERGGYLQTRRTKIQRSTAVSGPVSTVIG